MARIFLNEIVNKTQRQKVSTCVEGEEGKETEKKTNKNHHSYTGK